MKRRVFAAAVTATMMLSACSMDGNSEGSLTTDLTEGTEEITASETAAVTTVETTEETVVETTSETTAETTIFELNEDTEVGDLVSFGTYDQVGDYVDGPAPIDWIVLTEEDGKLLLLSRYIVDYKAYNEDMVDITWEECTLRAWLNDEFYNAAFDASEQEQILTMTISNPDNMDYGTGTEGGNDTEDNIFLLSSDEVLEYLPTEQSRAVSGCDWWWLRSPGFRPNHASIVLTGGEITTHGHLVNLDCYDHGVRPAIWVEIDE